MSAATHDMSSNFALLFVALVAAIYLFKNRTGRDD